jgi:hypothetical protein
MTVRTTSRTVTFVHPFSLSGTDEVHPAGTYTVETDEELLEPSSFPAYRRIATLIRLERTRGDSSDSDRRNESGGARGGPSERRATGRNSAATGSQRRWRVSEKGAWSDGILP